MNDLFRRSTAPDDPGEARQRASDLLDVIERRAIERVTGILSFRIDDAAWPILAEVHRLGAKHPMVAEYVDTMVQLEIARHRLGEFAKVIPKWPPLPLPEGFSGEP